ncbi:unnamed protein product [Rotaria socialis]|uniref:Acyl carrier protein n=2 Tax=Rotaria socialis TaxID=392032 RepID=A0A817XQD4_9BILA|nr:unnamed protein product [Rotaria socialis]CAF3371258.1 unnamed protein product [Rotaria socialis]CAF4157037.1 unnamed protein product [Rotaria socialis]
MFKTIIRQCIALQPIVNARLSTSITHRLHTLSNRTNVYHNTPIWSHVIVSRRKMTTDQSAKDAGQMRTPPPLTPSDVERRVLRICNEYDKILETKNHEITLSTNLMKDLGLDSLDLVEIIVALENEFGFEIPDSEYDKLYIVKSMVDYLVNKMNIVAGPK